jgi:hypothetical protein
MTMRRGVNQIGATPPSAPRNKPPSKEHPEKKPQMAQMTPIGKNQ